MPFRDDGKVWMSSREVAELLGISMARVRQLATKGFKEGGLDPKKVHATANVFDQAQVREYIANLHLRKRPGRPPEGFKVN